MPPALLCSVVCWSPDCGDAGIFGVTVCRLCGMHCCPSGQSQSSYGAAWLSLAPRFLSDAVTTQANIGCACCNGVLLVTPEENGYITCVYLACDCVVLICGCGSGQFGDNKVLPCEGRCA